MTESDGGNVHHHDHHVMGGGGAAGGEGGGSGMTASGTDCDVRDTNRGNGILIPWGFYPHVQYHHRQDTITTTNDTQQQQQQQSQHVFSPPCKIRKSKTHMTKQRMIDETDAAWRARSKHFFVLSHSGKPIWTRYGDENALAGFMAVIQALISFVADAGDTLRHITLNETTIAAIKVKGPIYLVTGIYPYLLYSFLFLQDFPSVFVNMSPLSRSLSSLSVQIRLDIIFNHCSLHLKHQTQV